jgi:GNAT superfamily N-acetyltransferase
VRGEYGQERWLVDMLESERAVDPDALAIVVAEAGPTVRRVDPLRARHRVRDLWGGATLPEWRRRGIYRATVAYQASLAAERGLRYLKTDGSDDSRPILERLGFTAVTTTTPYVCSSSTPSRPAQQ